MNRRLPAKGEEIDRGVDALRTGGLVAFPTETVYGLGASATSRRAVERLYEVKGRPPDHPVIVHIGDPDQLDELGDEISDDARLLAAACWPGPLTIVVRRRPGRVADVVTGGLDTIGLRVPDQRVAVALLRSFGGPIAAPSANRFGRVSPTTAAHVRADLGDDVDVVLDDGPCAVGVESTIVDCSSGAVAVLRPGGATTERLATLLDRPVATRPVGEGPRAPGRLAAHYAPRARVVVIGHTELERAVAASLGRHERVGLLATVSTNATVPRSVEVLNPPADAADFARVLYTRLREADERGLDTLLVIPPSAIGLGAAVVDRLRRAATGSVERA